jgi:hypothetical protein
LPQITREGPTSQQSGQTTRELAKATLGNKVENMYAADPKTEQEIRAFIRPNFAFISWFAVLQQQIQQASCFGR